MAAPSYVLGLLLVLTGLVGYFQQTPYVTVVPTGAGESFEELTLHADGTSPAKFLTSASDSASEQAKALKDDVIFNGNSDGSQGWYAVVKGDRKKPELRIFHPKGIMLDADDWSKVGLKDKSGKAISGSLKMGKSPTALIPAIFGLIFIGCAFGSQKKPSLRKHLMHVAALFALLGTAVPAKMAWSSYAENEAVSADIEKELKDEGVQGVRPSPVKFLSQGVTAVLCFFFLILAIQSFIKARKQAAAAAVNGPAPKRKPLRKPMNEKDAKTAKPGDSSKRRDLKEKDSDRDQQDSQSSGNERKTKEKPEPSKGKPILRASGAKKSRSVKLGSKSPMIAAGDKQKDSKLPSKPTADDKPEKTNDDDNTKDEEEDKDEATDSKDKEQDSTTSDSKDAPADEGANDDAKPAADSSKPSEDKAADDDNTKDEEDKDEATDSKDKEQDSTTSDSKDAPADEGANDDAKPAADPPKPPEGKADDDKKPDDDNTTEKAEDKDEATDSKDKEQDSTTSDSKVAPADEGANDDAKPAADPPKPPEGKADDDKKPDDDNTTEKAEDRGEATDSRDKEQDSTPEDSKDDLSDEDATDGAKPAADPPKPPEDKDSSSEKTEGRQEPKSDPEPKKDLGPMPPPPGSIGTPSADSSLTKPSSGSPKPSEDKKSGDDPSKRNPDDSPNQTPRFRLRGENKPIRINRPKPPDPSSGKEED